MESSELDLFEPPSVQTNIETGKFVEYAPIASIDYEAPIEFMLKASGDEYLDPCNIYLDLKVTLTDEGAADPQDFFGPVNNYFHSIFSQVEVLLNGKNISQSNNL